MKKDRINTNGESEGLTHNPFAALRPDGAPPLPEKQAPKVGRDPVAEQAGSKVVVRREKKGRGGKTVTRVSGLNFDSSRLDEFKRELKRALGCGASIEENDVLLQGDMTARAATWIEKRLAVSVTIGN